MNDDLRYLSFEDRARIDAIIAANLASGRADKVMRRWRNRSARSSSSREQQIRRYRTRVTNVYRQESRRVAALSQRDDEAWTTLWRQLFDVACSILQRGGRSAAEAESSAPDFVQLACVTIYARPFPFDVAFDAWVNTILRNHILQRIARSTDMLDRYPNRISLDPAGEGGGGHEHTPLARFQHIVDSSALERMIQQENRVQLLEAIGQIQSKARQQVIVYTYFEELHDAEIAARLSKSRGAVHSLRHRALKQLGVILRL